MGDGLTAADVYVGSHIGFGMEFGTIEKRPAFERYWQRLSARPALQRANEIDEQLASHRREIVDEHRFPAHMPASGIVRNIFANVMHDDFSLSRYAGRGQG